MINLEAFPSGNLQLSGIQPELLQDGGVNVVNMRPLVHRSQPDRIGRAIRGGAFDYEARKARSSFRTDNFPDYRSYTIGFRIVQQIKTKN